MDGDAKGDVERGLYWAEQDECFGETNKATNPLNAFSTSFGDCVLCKRIDELCEKSTYNMSNLFSMNDVHTLFETLNYIQQRMWVIQSTTYSQMVSSTMRRG